MRNVTITTAQPPADPASALTSNRLWSVTLGNHIVVRFTSERRALAFQAEASRFLSDAMLQCNLLLIECFTGYRMAWPYLEPTRKQTKDSGGAKCGEHVADAQRSLDLASVPSDNPDAVFRKWKQLANAVASVRHVGITLERLYGVKTHSVPRHQMAQLVSRCNALANELRYFGTDVTASHSSQPSPHATF